MEPRSSPPRAGPTANASPTKAVPRQSDGSPAPLPSTQPGKLESRRQSATSATAEERRSANRSSPLSPPAGKKATDAPASAAAPSASEPQASRPSGVAAVEPEARR